MGNREKETDKAWEQYLGLGLKIPCLLRVTMPGGEGRGVIWEEDEGELGWQGTGLREAGSVEVKGGRVGEEEGIMLGGRVAGPKARVGPDGNWSEQGGEEGGADGPEVVAGP